ncbi:MAG: NADH:ubiquinone oxidoreductase subunit NDUFA12 [Phyllobacteriaceae bacterium]|nr:NADH:ubiquinone oxidoreductase subunit NDUFA12 [Phyllobacteriaceae bacterium]
MKKFLLLFFTWWQGITVGTWWYTRTKGEFVGEDEFGNKYYRSKGGEIHPILGVERRWVLFNGEAEGSKVPPGWHGWMHHRTDVPPTEDTGYKAWPWQKPHMPNPTGTPAAHRPQGSILGAAKRAAQAGDYVAWKPE